MISLDNIKIDAYTIGIHKLVFGTKNYYLKVYDASTILDEYDNYQKASKVFPSCFKITIPNLLTCPKSFKSGIVMQSYGDTLATEITKGNIEEFDIEQIGYLLLDLLSNNILWGGFVPRNLFYPQDENLIQCIDLEDLFLDNDDLREIPALYLMKWALGWEGYTKEHINASELFEALYCFFEKSGYQITYSSSKIPLDQFEYTYQKIFPYKDDLEVRRHCTNITLQSEASVITEEKNINFFNIGHQIEDLLYSTREKEAPYLSIFFTFALKKIRVDLDSAASEDLADWLNKMLHKNELKKIFFHFIERINGQTLNCLTIYRAGFENSINRAESYEVLLKNIIKCLCNIFELDGIEIWLRGSLASGICSIYSDIDFEVPTKPENRYNALAIENMIISLLSMLDIPSEGTEGRPSEQDYHSFDYSDTRDLHELMELRILGSPLTLFDKMDDYVLPENWWAIQSLYEKSLVKLTPKLVFFQVRTLLLRYANNKGVSLNHLPTFINNYKDDPIIKELQQHLKKSLVAYEENDSSLAEEISNLNILLAQGLGFLSKGQK